jgi:hypothetical protein
VDGEIRRKIFEGQGIWGPYVGMIYSLVYFVVVDLENK